MGIDVEKLFMLKERVSTVGVEREKLFNKLQITRYQYVTIGGVITLIGFLIWCITEKDKFNNTWL